MLCPPGAQSPAGMLWTRVSQSRQEASGCPGAGVDLALGMKAACLLRKKGPVPQGKRTLSFSPWVLIKGSAKE